MRKVFILSMVFGTLSGGAWILHAQEKQPAAPSNMGGVVTGGLVTSLDQGPKPSIAHFRFDPGARTKWHTHEVDQIVLVEEGVGRTQVKGGPVIELRPGEIAYVGPGVLHWHGAAPDQYAVQFNISRGKTTFTDEVSDQEYLAAPKKK